MPITPEDLFPGVVDVESSWRPGISGPSIPGTSQRAIGLTQVMPSLAARYGYQPGQLTQPAVQWDIYNRHMGYLLKKYKGDPALALAAWNDGEENVDRNSIAPSTLKYVVNAMRKSPQALAKFRAEYRGTPMPADTDVSSIMNRVMSNPKWSTYNADQQAQIYKAIQEEYGTPKPGTPKPSATATKRATPSPTPSPKPTKPPVPPSTVVPAGTPSPVAETPKATPGATPTLGLPGGPAIARGGPQPVELKPESFPGPYGTPSENFPSRTFGAPGPDIPTPLQQLQSKAAQADAAHWIYKPIRQAGTWATRKLAQPLTGDPESAEEAAQGIFPQDPVTAALLGTQLALTAAGMPEALGIEEALADVPVLGKTLETSSDIAKVLGYGAQEGPEASVPFATLRRLGTDVGVGGITGAASAPSLKDVPESAVRGAEQGAIMGGIGETTALGAGMVGRSGITGRYVNQITSDVGDELGTAFGSGRRLEQIELPPIKSPQDFEDVFVGRNAEGNRAANKAMDTFKDEVNHRLGGTPTYTKKGGVPQFPMWDELPLKGADRARYQAYTGKNPPSVTIGGRQQYFAATGINVPRPKYVMMTFDEINEEITRCNDLSHNLRGDPLGSAKARYYDDKADWLRSQLRDNLDRQFPGENMGDQFMTLRRKVGLLRDINRNLTAQNIGVWKDKELIPENLQRFFGEKKMANAYSGLMGRDKWEALMRATRGGLGGPAYSTPGEELSVHGGPGRLGHARFSRFKTFKPVGTPEKLFQVGKGMIYPPRALYNIPAAILSQYGLAKIPSPAFFGVGGGESPAPPPPPLRPLEQFQ